MTVNVRMSRHRSWGRMLVGFRPHSSHLCARDLVHAINTFAVPVAMYGFGIVRWNRSVLCHMDTSLRTTLSINGLQHPRASVERLYASRKLGGREFLNPESLHDQCLVFLAKYNSQREEPIIKCLFRYHLSVLPPGRFIVMRTEKFLRSIDC